MELFFNLSVFPLGSEGVWESVIVDVDQQVGDLLDTRWVQIGLVDSVRGNHIEEWRCQ